MKNYCCCLARPAGRSPLTVSTYHRATFPILVSLSLSPLLSVRLPMPPILLASPLLLGYIVVRVSYESCVPLILIVVLRALVVVAPRREASWNHRAS